MAEPNRRSSSKQVFDVAKPNKSRPSNTARPVIITNRPILQDPMVNAVPSNDEPTGAPPLVIKLPTKINIAPLSNSTELTVGSEPVAAKNSADDSAVSTMPDATSPISEHLEKTRVEAAANSEAQESPATEATTPDLPAKDSVELGLKSGTAPIADTPKDGAQVTDKDLSDQEDVANEVDENIQNLVAEKRYFLPINTQEKQRTKHFIILGVTLILLLAAIWVDIALDAGLIHLDGVKPLTHLFSN